MCVLMEVEGVVSDELMVDLYLYVLLVVVVEHAL